MGKGARNREIRELALIAKQVVPGAWTDRSPKSIARRMRKNYRRRFVQGKR